MSCDLGEVTEGLENEQSSFSNLSVNSPTSQLIVLPFFRLSYVTGSSPGVPPIVANHILSTSTLRYIDKSNCKSIILIPK